MPSFVPTSSHTGEDDDFDYDDLPSVYSISRSSPVDRRRSTGGRHDGDIDENTGLLESQRSGHMRRSYTESPALTRRPTFFRNTSTSGSLRRSRHHSRKNSQNARFGLPSDSHTPSLPANNSSSAKDGMMTSSFMDERAWYDQFTSTDWVHDSIADGNRLRTLRSRKDIRGRLLALFDSAQGWILVAVIGCITALIAYFVDIMENFIFDLKEGYCSSDWFSSRRNCCSPDDNICPAWRSWSNIVTSSKIDNLWIDYGFFIVSSIFLAAIGCALTLLTKTVAPSTISLSTLDENLAADSHVRSGDKTAYTKLNSSPIGNYAALPTRPAMVYYSAAGSGVAEVKVILSGFVLHGYLGVRTLVLKTIALIFSISAGLSLGKEGPYVHIASCVGNIFCRIFSKYRDNDGKRREVLSASASSGVAVAFGAPIGGVLFGLEEVSYYFPPKTLFRTFFCCIAAALSLKFLNPYGTGKIVPFEVRYATDWEIFEMIIFIFLGVLGGLAGALFIKATALWARSFRRIPVIKRWPILEVVLVALVTGVVGYWNRYTKLAVSELMFELASPCDEVRRSNNGLCPDEDGIMDVVVYLLGAFVIKAILTTITFGIKVPAGIYVPSMVVGGLMGRIVGHLTQYLVVKFPDFIFFSSCPAGSGVESCVVPGVYAMVAAGATMCGVTRLSVTLAVILFELTGSLDHVLPFSIAVLCAKWTADAVEPRSIYDLLTDMNSYPFLDNKTHPTCEAYLGDIVPPVRRHRMIDITSSPLVLARELREKLDYLLMAGELDSGLPIVRDGVLMGLIPAPDLEYALDKLEDEDDELCIMSVSTPWSDVRDDVGETRRLNDFTPHIDPSPIALDVHSPIDLVYQCFVKLGLRYICVLRDGKYAGLVHKKLFVKFMKENEE